MGQRKGFYKMKICSECGIQFSGNAAYKCYDCREKKSKEYIKGFNDCKKLYKDLNEDNIYSLITKLEIVNDVAARVISEKICLELFQSYEAQKESLVPLKRTLINCPACNCVFGTEEVNQRIQLLELANKNANQMIADISNEMKSRFAQPAKKVSKNDIEKCIVDTMKNKTFVNDEFRAVTINVGFYKKELAQAIFDLYKG